MSILKKIFGRKKSIAGVDTSASPELEQAMARKALRGAAQDGVLQAQKLGCITKAQAATILTNMEMNPSLRTILEELITTLESNGAVEHAALIRDIDTELFKGCVSPGQPAEGL